ncbi:PREDICTED: olfactory receptor 6F1-like [Gekko japonicus]|uniref:Olfactory receptor n=1 Tax=Gekko japonicus TaxID=146911 RepID=A0ABM1KWT5_GEKJA|nr:PREDICTED: olfactory receptor 6F1-like [Gekko japonicus]
MGENYQVGQNETRVQEFILLTFTGSLHLRIFIFPLFLIMYILAISGNLAIIILVLSNGRLHTVMYYLLCNLSFLEIWYTTTTIPKTLPVLLGRSQSISFTGCLLQMYFSYSFGCIEYFLLAIMAYDRYVAICHPLRYNTIMDISLSGKLAVSSWLGGFIILSAPAFLIARLSFCGPNVINHFLCSVDAWIVLSCSETHAIEMAIFLIAVFVIFSSFSVTLLSYIYIVSTILHISSTNSLQKAFSTCSSHFAVVVIWYGSTIFLFVKPSKSRSLETTKTVNILNIIVTPVLNPFIYTLRNKEVREAFRSSLHLK